MSHKHHALFPGSFDPLTNGHVDIIRRTLKIFDHITVAVLFNSEKKTLFSVEERVALIQAEFKDQSRVVTVESFSGLLVEFAKSKGINVLIRGLRAISDYDYEAQMALMNKNLSEDIETFFLNTREKHSYISSTLVKQVASLGGAVDNLVPPGIAKALADKIRSKGARP